MLVQSKMLQIKSITSNKNSFLAYLETNLANDANLPIYPKGGGENKELTCFFTQKPKIV